MVEQVSWELKAADPRTFSGTAYSALMCGAESEAPVKLYFVRFEAGARTFWHTHSGPQILVIRSGRCRYQRQGSSVQEALAGESLRFEPGERHWHGASPDEAMEHVAVNLTGGETLWEQAVTEEEYGQGGGAVDRAAIFTSAPPS